MTLFYSMAAFALAASITPGPVNVVALGSGARFGLLPSLRHVTGATVGFIILLVSVGFGVYELLQRMPALMHAIQWFGVAFLLYMAYRLARDDGELGDANPQRGPTMLNGAVMQWLNPKGMARVVGRHGGVHRRRTHPHLAVRRDLLRRVLAFRRMLGRRRCHAAAAYARRSARTTPQSRHGRSARRKRGVSGGKLTVRATQRDVSRTPGNAPASSRAVA